MNKSIIMVSIMTIMACQIALAQTDVTSQYITNPSFEDDDVESLDEVNNTSDGLRGYSVTAPKGWGRSGADVTSLLVTKNCYTDNKFGIVSTLSDGEQAYYMRMGWSNGTSSMVQTIKSLPAGHYMLKADVRSAYANSATSSFSLIAGDNRVAGSFDQGSTSYFNTVQWKTHSLSFETSEDVDLMIGLIVNWQSGGSCIMIDNIRLLQLPEGYEEPENPTEESVVSPTEGVINNVFVAEADMMTDLLQMLANFSTYLKNDYQDASAANSVGEACGCFRSNSTMQNNEDGVRSNADLSMVTAFLCKYGKGKVVLPDGVSWDQLETIAMKSLVFAYSTHKANKLKVCAGNNYWGSLSNSDHVWESSLWAMSVAYSAFFQWDKLTDAQKGYVESLLKAECNYELERSIPTGYNGDTKAEENGWEADILAVTLGLFPDDALAPKWFDRLREFAINSYSHADDATDNTVIDPDYDQKTVSDLYKGQNLYDDYTLQNHNYFHTSYQNVVIQELGEAALALKLFQTELHGTEKWKTNALIHGNAEVQKEVLNWLALADGELAMPNGNDWSLFLYDQITSYTTNAVFLRDADALMLENLAYKMIKARQTTTDDGSWLLRSDIGARRMGVEAHRVMMTWLMHEVMSTSDMTPTDFEDFRNEYKEAKLIKTQNIVRSYTKDRFTTFSWAPGISSYTGYIASNSVDKNKIVVPFKANNTGNFIGWYTVSGQSTNATPVVNGIYQFDGSAWTMNGELSTNGATLDNRFAIYSTPGNAVIYLDYVAGLANGTITKEQGGLMAISVDELTRLKRTLYYESDEKMKHRQLDGTTFTTFDTDWINIDNALGVVNKNGSGMAFGDRSNNNSIMTAKLYTAYDSDSRPFKTGDVVDARSIVYYSNVTAEQTKQMNDELVPLRDKLPEGWNGVIANDPDGTQYLMLSNFMSMENATLSNINTEYGAPVFCTETSIIDNNSSASFTVEPNHSVSQVIRYYLKASEIRAIEREDSLYVEGQDGTVYVINTLGLSKEVTATGKPQRAWVADGEIQVEDCESFPSDTDEDLTKGYENVTGTYLTNSNFEEDETYGAEGTNVKANGVTYASCYVNEVSASNSKWPNVLPVKGWTAGGSLKNGSNYCRMYSMPYSLTKYVVSPSGVGNYAARTTSLMADDNAGGRTLTVLNSWDSGNNCITQSVNLPEGRYRLILDMKYECQNEIANDGRQITSSSAVNKSLTGVNINGETDYRYPDNRNEWEVMVYDFELTAATDVTISLGYSINTSTGAANNTLLYIDNVRLFREVATGIKAVSTDASVSGSDSCVYNLAGQRLSHPQKGINIIGGKKIIY